MKLKLATDGKRTITAVLTAVVATLAIVAFSLFSMHGSTSALTARPSTDESGSLAGRAGPVEEALVASGQYRTWSYTAVREADGRLTAAIRADLSSPDAINAYAEANRVLVEQLSSSRGELGVEVTFKAPMLPAEFRDWAKAAGISYFLDVQLRVVNAGGERSTTGVVSNSPNPLPQQSLDSILSGYSRAEMPLSVEGVFFLRGRAQAADLVTLSRDERVFMLDVTSNVVRQKLRDVGVFDVDRPSTTVYNPLSVFAAMEQFGMVPKATSSLVITPAPIRALPVAVPTGTR